MELEFTDRSRRRRLLLIIGLILAILAGSTAFFLGNQGAADAEPVSTRRVLVAADIIPARTIIQASHLVTREVPDDPSLALALTDPQEVLGLVTAVTVYADQPITRNLIATAAVGEQFSILAPIETISPYSPVWRAVSISVPRDRAVGGLVTPGQRVDVIATVSIEIRTENENGQLVEGTTLDGYYTNESTKVIMTDVEVLSQEPDSDIYVLKVDLHQAEEIAVLQAKGAAMNLALRPQGDNRVIDRDGYGETVNRVVEEYVFPLPRVIQVDRYPKPEAEVVPEGTPTVEWPDPDPALVPDASIDPNASPVPGASPDPSAEPSPEPSPQAGRNRG